MAEGLLPAAERPSGEVREADVISRFVVRSSTGADETDETDDVLTAPRHASRTPSAYRASMALFQFPLRSKALDNWIQRSD